MARESYEEIVWADAGRKLNGVCREAEEARRAGLNVLVVAHFEGTLSAAAAALRERGIEHRSGSSLEPSSLCGAGASVWLALAAHLRKPEPHASAAAGGSERLRVVVAEHHPLASRDRAIVEAVRALPCAARVTFHAALTDPLFSRFGGERILGLMKRMGLDESEPVSHPLISGAVRKAQEKIEKKVHGELPVSSAEVWFKYNLRDGSL